MLQTKKSYLKNNGNGKVSNGVTSNTLLSWYKKCIKYTK